MERLVARWGFASVGHRSPVDVDASGRVLVPHPRFTTIAIAWKVQGGSPRESATGRKVAGEANSTRGAARPRGSGGNDRRRRVVPLHHLYGSLCLRCMGIAGPRHGADSCRTAATGLIISCISMALPMSRRAGSFHAGRRRARRIDARRERRRLYATADPSRQLENGRARAVELRTESVPSASSTRVATSGNPRRALCAAAE
jgi:hypothetical protein